MDRGCWGWILKMKIQDPEWGNFACRVYKGLVVKSMGIGASYIVVPLTAWPLPLWATISSTLTVKSWKCDIYGQCLSIANLTLGLFFIISWWLLQKHHEHGQAVLWVRTGKCPAWVLANCRICFLADYLWSSSQGGATREKIEVLYFILEVGAEHCFHENI